MGTICVTELRQTCHACPSQWEGRTLHGDYVYVRYRWGGLTIGVGPTIEAAVMDSGNILDRAIGGGYDGFLTYEQLVEATKDCVVWADKRTSGDSSK